MEVASYYSTNWKKKSLTAGVAWRILWHIQDESFSRNVLVLVWYWLNHWEVSSYFQGMTGSTTITSNTAPKCPAWPWSHLHRNFVEPLEDHTFLILIAYSKRIAFCTPSVTLDVFIDKLRTVFTRFGIPETIVTDNGHVLWVRILKHSYIRKALSIPPQLHIILPPMVSWSEPYRE